MEMWSTARILGDVEHTNEAGVEIERKKLLQDQGKYRKSYSLAAYMVSNGTWPLPPLVIDNDRDIMAKWFADCAFSGN